MAIMELDILSVCRICLLQSSKDEMISIYDKDDEENLFIFEKIEKCADIKLTNDPELPSNICQKCNVFLTFAFKFHIMCRNSNSYLYEFGLKDVDDNLAFEETEYPVEYNTINDSEDELKDVFWLKTEDDIEDLEAEEDIMASSIKLQRKQFPLQQQQQQQEQQLTPQSRSGRKNKPEKTLNISSDGAAVIRVNNAKQLEKELKKNQSHICDICGNVYPKKYALEAHVRRHRNERPFECEICQQRFIFNFQLSRHILKHTGARPYNCAYCQRSFTDRSTMKKHERLHRNERPYKCETCGKTFTYSSVLKVHRLTHTGEKPFNCGICGKRFARSHHLRAHLETLLHSKDPQAKLLLKQIRREDNIFEEDA